MDKESACGDIDSGLIENWTNSNRLTLNYSKTNCVLFSNVKSKSNKDFCINTLNGTLPKKNTIKYLGVMVDHKLTWEEHTIYVIQKLTKAKGILAKLRHHAPQSILINVYHSIVYPHLYYGATSWGNTAAKYTDRIQIKQNSIVKIITKLPFIKTKISPLFDKLNLLRLDDIYKLEVLKFMFSFKKKILLNCFKDYFTIPSEIHEYPARFACDDNWEENFHCTKSTTQRSIKFTACKLWNDLPSEFKSIRELSLKSFRFFFIIVGIFILLSQESDKALYELA